MISYEYWVDAPATVTGGIALEACYTYATSSTQHSYGYTNEETSSVTGKSFGVTAGEIILAALSMQGMPAELTATSVGSEERVTDRSHRGSGEEVRYTGWSRTRESVTWFSKTALAVAVGDPHWSSYGTTTHGFVAVRSITQTVSADHIHGEGTSTKYLYSTVNDTSELTGTTQSSGFGFVPASTQGSHTAQWTHDAVVTIDGIHFSKGTFKSIFVDSVTSLFVSTLSWTGWTFGDAAPRMVKEVREGLTAVASTMTVTVKSFADGAPVDVEHTYTAMTSATCNYDFYYRTTTITRKEDAAGMSKYLRGERVSVTVFEVGPTECLVTRRGEALGFLAPGTYEDPPGTLGLAGGDYLSLTTQSEYRGLPGCGTTTGGYSGYGYVDYEATITTVTDSTVDRATAVGDGVPPLDGAVGLSLSSGGSTTTSFNIYASYGPTYIYTYTGYGDKRATMESGYTTSYGGLYVLLEGGRTLWTVSSYSYSNSPLTLLVTGASSQSASSSGTRTSVYQTLSLSTTSITSSSSVGVGTTVWGQRYKSSLAKRTEVDADDYWTYTHDETARNMLGFSVECTEGFRGDRAQGIFSNLAADEYPPTLRDGQLYSTHLYGGRIPAFHGSGVVTENGASYSTTHLTENSYRVSSSGWTTDRTCVWQAAGEPETYASWKEYVDYAETNPPTVIGDGRDLTVSMMLQDQTWYSRMALAYTSVNTVAGGTTRSTTEYAPWYLTRDTTLAVGSQCQVAFRLYPYALSSSGERIDVVSTTRMYDFDESSTMDLWKY